MNLRSTRSGLPSCRAALILLFAIAGTRAGEPREVRGRVIDGSGQPVVGAVIDDFWRANGTGKDRDGAYLDLKNEENLKEFWGHLGEMEPCSPRVATSGPDGQFLVSISRGPD